MVAHDAHRPVVVERVATPRGELVLRRVDATGDLEIISNGTFLMDTRGGASERLLVDAALDGRAGPARVLLGGLGVGFSLRAALDHPRVAAVTVVEVESAVIAWHATHLAHLTAGAVDDPRVTVVCADLTTWVRRPGARFDAICLDIDNGPGWTVTEGNAALYDDAGMAALRARLTPGGTITVWSATAEDDVAARLRRHFTAVHVRTVDVDRGAPDHVYVARAPAAS